MIILSFVAIILLCWNADIGICIYKEDSKMANDAQILVEILQGTHAPTGGG